MKASSDQPQVGQPHVGQPHDGQSRGERSRGTVLVTGAGGFIGRDLVVRLRTAGFAVRAATRNPSQVAPGDGIEPVALPDLERALDWRPLLDGATHAVHLAGIAHATSAIAEGRYRAVNGDASASLAAAARGAGLATLVLMSSVRAQSGPTAASVLTEAVMPQPTDAYGRSKLEAETAVLAALAGCPTRAVCLRPVVIYGPGAKGNMAALAALARSPLPLPLATLTARRSILAVENLAAAVVHALVDHRVSPGAYLVADPGPLTVAEMIAAMREGLARKPGLFSAPAAAMNALARLAGRAEAWQRLSQALVVDTAKLQATGWRPPVTTRAALAAWLRAGARPI